MFWTWLHNHSYLQKYSSESNAVFCIMFEISWHYILAWLLNLNNSIESYDSKLRCPSFWDTLRQTQHCFCYWFFTHTGIQRQSRIPWQNTNKRPIPTKIRRGIPLYFNHNDQRITGFSVCTFTTYGLLKRVLHVVSVELSLTYMYVG